MPRDLVERLRESADACEFTTRAALLAGAADEIERLRKEVEMWKALAMPDADLQ